MKQNLLVETKIRAIKPEGTKPRRYADGNSLYLTVFPSGGKVWQMRYFGQDGKERIASLGRYPAVSLAEARRQRDEIKVQLAAGDEPTSRKKAEADAEKTFGAVAARWLQKKNISESHRLKLGARLRSNLLFDLADRPIKEISRTELLKVLEKVEARGALSMTHRCAQTCGEIWNFAISAGLVENNITANIKGALKPHMAKGYPGIVDPVRLGQLLRDIDNYAGSPEVRHALRLGPLVALRSAELRFGEWSEIDWDKKVWTIPPNRMKGRQNEKRPHLAPLCAQAIQILSELKKSAAAGNICFRARAPRLARSAI